MILQGCRQFHILKRCYPSQTTDDLLFRSGCQKSPGRIDIVFLQRSDHLIHMNAVIEHLVWINQHMNLLNEPAHVHDIGDARHGLETGLQIPIREVTCFIQIVAFDCKLNRICEHG